MADHLSDDDAAWERYWRQWPIAAWTGELRGSPGSGLFRVEGNRLVPAFDIPDELTGPTSDLVAELLDYRLCRYLEGKERHPGEWALRVSQTNGRPIIWLNRERNPGLPEGEVDLLVEARSYRAAFVKIALNVIRDPETGENRLPEILRGWFGAEAGAPGTAQSVWLRAHNQTFELTIDSGHDPMVS